MLKRLGIKGLPLTSASNNSQYCAMTTPAAFLPGFRISVRDVIVLIPGAAAAWWVARIDLSLSLAVLFTVGHFFLFCNVVRMARKLELIWTAIFLVLAVCAQLLQVPSWNQTFAICLVATCVLVATHLRSPSYHGLGWQRINPGLPEWWAENSTQFH